MSQKNQYIKKSNNTVKNRSNVKGGQGTVFSQLKDMFKANSSANKQIEEMTTLQTTLKENLKTIDDNIDTFKKNYDKLVSKVSYVDSRIKDITDVNEQCKKLHPSVVNPTVNNDSVNNDSENKKSESNGFFGSLFGSTPKTDEPKTDESKYESESGFNTDSNPFSGIFDTLESNKQKPDSSHKELIQAPSNIFDKQDTNLSDIFNSFGSHETPAIHSQPVNPTPVNPIPVNPIPVNPTPMNPTPMNPIPVIPSTTLPDISPSFDIPSINTQSNPFGASTSETPTKPQTGTKGGI